MDGLTRGRTIAIAGALIALTAAILLAMGRTPICTCGTIKLWHAAASSPETSQHIADPYTFSHVLHGVLFYWLIGLVAPAMPLARRFLVAVGLEAGWEVLENSSFIIERYRTQTLALNYFGDSVLNSVADILAMAAGFVFAAAAPVWASVALFVGIEAASAYLIRDNLTLNIIMLLHPFESIKGWQQAG